MTSVQAQLSDGPSPLVAISSRTATYAEHTEGMPMLEQESAQLGPGRPEFLSIQVRGRDVTLTELLLEPKYIGHYVPDPEWCVLLAPLRWRGDYIFNGREVRPGDLFLTGAAIGCTTVAADRHNLAIGFRKARLSAICQALLGHPQDGADFSDRLFTLNTPLGVRLLRDAKAAIIASSRSPIAGRRHTLPFSLEADLLTTIGLFLVDQNIAGASRDPGRIESLSIVRKAKRLIEARNPQPVSLAELCEASGVGKAWLHKCFVEIYGISPMNYLRAQRLTVARERLLDVASPPRSVKDVSFALGFTNGGRFAAQYLKLFGEHPSETLETRMSRGAGITAAGVLRQCMKVKRFA